ncbi:anthranilate synthase, component II [Caldanaerovirga acetigignens]|uniref:Anthranilate synthase, component II n=1 Tax=Caldanaerovirga acetigignens TaxID=447595 RepID=A0A1M7HM23_9FIRM|nr:aminodeoxychorismate/anthranilate synthase component II [Caldanaerovirga acetigignens]SHM29591.1 anthranilate synthase, component II [Caldanaerovirga acetigignens]
MVLIIDNYDSFTYNLYQYIREIYPRVEVARNDEVSPEQILGSGAKGIVLSPGPGRPEEAGICVELVRKAAGRIPIIGICLGHQAIGYSFGAKVVKADKILHGKTSLVVHEGKGILKGLKSPVRVARYHSLVLDENSIPPELEVTAKTLDGTIMAIMHKHFPLFGIQFHPESIMTEYGKEILRNFIGVMLDAEGSH